MKKFVYITFMLLLLSSCASKKLCQKYPDTFLNAYFPYQMEQKISFSNGNDTMNFISEEVYIYENYTEEYGQLFCKCGEPAPCLPIYVIFIEDSKLIKFSYFISNDNQLNFRTEIETKEDYYFDIAGSPSKSFTATPFDNNVLEIVSDTIKLEDNRESSNFYQVDIVRDKGIFAFYEKLENGDTIKWELVE